MKRKNLWVQLAVLSALGSFGSMAAQAADPAKINWNKIPAAKVAGKWVFIEDQLIGWLRAKQNFGTPAGRPRKEIQRI